jgi:hypothetical protein
MVVLSAGFARGGPSSSAFVCLLRLFSSSRFSGKTRCDSVRAACASLESRRRRPRAPRCDSAFSLPSPCLSWPWLYPLSFLNTVSTFIHAILACFVMFTHVFTQAVIQVGTKFRSIILDMNFKSQAYLANQRQKQVHLGLRACEVL